MSSTNLTNEPLWKIICIHSPTWRLLLILLTYIAAQMIMLPWLPQLMTNDFARRRAGKTIHCEDFAPADAPDACQNAHGDVVLWSTWSGFAQNAIFSVILVHLQIHLSSMYTIIGIQHRHTYQSHTNAEVICTIMPIYFFYLSPLQTPALGAWSDIHGRKPLLITAMSCTVLPYLFVLLNLHFNTPLFWLYVIQTFTGSISVIAPSLSYIADSTPPQHRASCFGLIMASFSLAILIGPPLGSLCSSSIAPVVTLSAIGICIFGTWMFLPESLTQEAIETVLQLHGTYNT